MYSLDIQLLYTLLLPTPTEHVYNSRSRNSSIVIIVIITTNSGTSNSENFLN